MQQIDFNATLDRVRFLVGSGDIVREMSSIPALPPFEETILSFLNDLSKELIGKREFSDIVTFGFWIRKANLLKMQERFFPARNYSHNCFDGWDGQAGRFHLGRGLVFHIAPSNVPVNFAYSLVSALLMGNNNIVRVPSKDFEQVKVITTAINMVLNDYPAMKSRIACVRYDHQDQQTAKQVNDLFSSVCDCRIIWGGDKTIETLRQSPLQPRSREITFADRYSLAVIDADKYLQIENKGRVAQDFYNDTFFSDQNACTSPRLLIWTADTDEKIAEAQQIFWESEHALVKTKYNFQPIMAVNKLTRAYLDAAKAQDSVKIEQSEDNLIVRVAMSDMVVEQLDNNSGFFYETRVSRSQLTVLMKSMCNDKRCQTVAYIGNSDMFTDVFKSGIKGIDRIVPIGHTMDFDLIWDGYDLTSELTRVVTRI